MDISIAKYGDLVDTKVERVNPRVVKSIHRHI